MGYLVASIVAKSASLHWSFRRHDTGHYIHHVVDAPSSIPSFAGAICQLRACAARGRSSVHLFGTAAKTVVANGVCGFSASSELVFSPCGDGLLIPSIKASEKVSVRPLQLLVNDIIVEVELYRFPGLTGT